MVIVQNRWLLCIFIRNRWIAEIWLFMRRPVDNGTRPKDISIGNIYCIVAYTISGAIPYNVNVKLKIHNYSAGTSAKVAEKNTHSQQY